MQVDNASRFATELHLSLSSGGVIRHAAASPLQGGYLCATSSKYNVAVDFTVRVRTIVCGIFEVLDVLSVAA